MNPTTLDLLADRVAEKVIERMAVFVDDRISSPSNSDPELIDAAEVAHRFGVSRDFVYDHADELGAIRLGDGDKPRLRFDPATVLDRLAARPHPATGPARTTRRRRSGTAADLLPIRGEA